MQPSQAGKDGAAEALRGVRTTLSSGDISRVILSLRKELNRTPEPRRRRDQLARLQGPLLTLLEGVIASDPGAPTEAVAAALWNFVESAITSTQAWPKAGLVREDEEGWADFAEELWSVATGAKEGPGLARWAPCQSKRDKAGRGFCGRCLGQDQALQFPHTKVDSLCNIQEVDVLLTSMLCPGIVFAHFFVMNLVLWYEGSSAAIPFFTLVALLALWFGVSVPLTFVGAFFGFRKRAIGKFLLLLCTLFEIFIFCPKIQL